jgi:hypothetical protein
VSYRATDLSIDCLRSLRAEIASVSGTRVAVCENGTGAAAVDRLRRGIGENRWSSVKIVENVALREREMQP